MDPSIELLGALLTATARCDSDRIGRALYYVTQADLIFDQKTWEPNAMGFPRSPFAGLRLVLFHRCSMSDGEIGSAALI
jgi:hypothetical protein